MACIKGLAVVQNEPVDVEVVFAPKDGKNYNRPIY